MKISSQFQKFFFGVVIPEIKKAPQPLKYQHPFTNEWALVDFSKVKDNSVYLAMKIVNPHYPKANNLFPKSTTLLDSKDMTKHIQWIERFLSQNGHTCKHIEQEWEQILNNSKEK
jgi:hypothetical protein